MPENICRQERLLKCFVSDNGKTSKVTSKYLDAVFKEGLVQEHLTGPSNLMWNELHGGEVHLKNGQINKTVPE